MKVPFVDPWSIATRIKSSSTCVIASKCSMQKTKTNSRNTNRPKRESLGCRISLQVAREQCFRDKELCSISISTQPPGTSQNLSAVWSKSVTYLSNIAGHCITNPQHPSISGRLAWTSNSVSLPQLKTPLSGTYASHIPEMLLFEMSGHGCKCMPLDTWTNWIWIDCQI